MCLFKILKIRIEYIYYQRKNWVWGLSMKLSVPVVYILYSFIILSIGTYILAVYNTVEFAYYYGVYNDIPDKMILSHVYLVGLISYVQYVFQFLSSEYNEVWMTIWFSIDLLKIILLYFLAILVISMYL